VLPATVRCSRPITAFALAGSNELAIPRTLGKRSSSCPASRATIGDSRSVVMERTLSPSAAEARATK